MASCSVEGCESPIECRALCNLHYKRWRRHGDPLTIGKPGNPRAYTPGDRVGRLTIVDYDPVKRGYRCTCDCGDTTIVQTHSLTSGDTRSCGCLARAATAERATTHGHSRSRDGKPTPTYKTWQAMRQRCENPHDDRYRAYGGRGIEVCDRWRKYENFLSDMGERPEGMTLDRINSDGDYEPGNCRWASTRTQARNRKTIKLTMQLADEIRKAVAAGERAIALAVHYGVDVETIRDVASRRSWRDLN